MQLQRIMIWHSGLATRIVLRWQSIDPPRSEPNGVTPFGATLRYGRCGGRGGGRMAIVPTNRSSPFSSTRSTRPPSRPMAMFPHTHSFPRTSTSRELLGAAWVSCPRFERALRDGIWRGGPCAGLSSAGSRKEAKVSTQDPQEWHIDPAQSLEAPIICLGHHVKGLNHR